MIYLPTPDKDELLLAEINGVKRILNDDVFLEVNRVQADAKREIQRLESDYWAYMLKRNEEARIEALRSGDKQFLHPGDWVRVPLVGVDNHHFTAQMCIEDIFLGTIYGRIGGDELHFDVDRVEWIDVNEVYPS